MKRRDFWEVIEASRQGAEGRFPLQLKRLYHRLRTMSLDEVASFERHFGDLQDEADSDELRTVANELGGGCGDDSWSDFTSWLISMGQGAYEAVIDEPEHLRGFAAESEDIEFEEFQHVAGWVENDLTPGVDDHQKPRESGPEAVTVRKVAQLALAG